MKGDSHLSKLWRRVEDSGRADRPDLWVKRKGVVVIVLGISVYAFYVAVGRSFAPAIQRRQGSSYHRAAGVGLLIGFIILWLMFMWSYGAIICTPPGYAKDVIPVTPKPVSQGPKPTLGAFAPVSPAGISDAVPAVVPASAGLYLTEGIPQDSDSKFRYVRRPNPVVDVGPRWCQHCKIIKPDRAHHCRHCGTCVLQFDHHCMWIGRCVGWNNHAVFVTFTFWAGLFCLYTAVVLIVDVAMSDNVDGQKIAIICVAGFLALFTAFMMLPTHIFLILKGRSTVESFQSSSQLKAEQSLLENEFQSKCLTADMRRVRRQWEAEYGGVAVNDRWAFGRKRDMWRREMGSSWVGWLLPIGRPLGDGVNFPANPRFGPNGEWLPMRDWPKVVAI